MHLEITSYAVLTAWLRTYAAIEFAVDERFSPTDITLHESSIDALFSYSTTTSRYAFGLYLRLAFFRGGSTLSPSILMLGIFIGTTISRDCPYWSGPR